MRDPDVAARWQLVRRSARRNRLVGRGNRQPSALRHGVAGIEAAVEDRRLHLARVHHAGHSPSASSVDTRTRRPSVGLASVTRSATRRFRSVGRGASRCRCENASSREVSCEPCNTAPVARSISRTRRSASADVQRSPALRHPALHQLQAAQHGGQHVVEVVRDAASQLAHRLQLLRLMQCGLGLLAFGDFHLQPVVALRQRAGALRHLSFQQFGLQPPFQFARLQAGCHGIERLRQCGELRAAARGPGPRTEIAVTPSSRRRQQVLGRTRR